MKRAIKNIIMPIILCAVVIFFALSGVELIKVFIPDGKNEVFTDKMSDKKQLMYINSEADDRFYHWLDVDNENTISYTDYLKTYVEVDDSEFTYFANSFNMHISLIINQNFVVSDNPSFITGDTDFSSNTKYNTKNCLFFLKNFECKKDDGTDVLIDIVISEEQDSVLYFRCRQKNTKTFTKTEINEAYQNLEKQLKLAYEYYQTDKAYTEIQEATESEPIYDDFEDVSDNTTAEDNIFIKYVESSYDALIKYSDIYNSGKEQNFEKYFLYSVFQERYDYTMLSYGDEIIIIFYEQGGRPISQSTMLYYSMTENKIIGFSA